MVTKERKRRLERAILCKERVLTKVVKEKMRNQIILLVSTVGVLLALNVGRGTIYAATNGSSLVILRKIVSTKYNLKLKRKWLINRTRTSNYLQQPVLPAATIVKFGLLTTDAHIM